MENTEKSLTEKWLTRLQESGYRLTTSRQAIVGLLASSHLALGPLELYDQARRQHPGLGLVTVYRTLEKLEELGLVQRVHQSGGCHAYLRACEGHQHLLFCTHCRRATFFGGEDLDFLFKDVSAATGYQVGEHWLQLYGLCPECQDTPECMQSTPHPSKEKVVQ